MRFHPDDEKAVRDENRAKWLGFIEAGKIIAAVAIPANIETKKEAATNERR